MESRVIGNLLNLLFRIARQPKIRHNHVTQAALSLPMCQNEAATVRTFMTKTQAWFERKFEFTFPVQQFPNLCVRLRGTPARLEEMVQGVSPEVLVAKPEGTWSAQEHAGHLADLESLWMVRVGDFFGNRETLTIADLTNQKTNNANHNARRLITILADFRAARFHLLDSIDKRQHHQPSL